MFDDDETFEDDEATAEQDSGRAQDEAQVECPYCGEVVEIALDPSGGGSQSYVEDCQVCCRPWRVNVRWGRDGSAVVTLAPEDEADEDE